MTVFVLVSPAGGIEKLFSSLDKATEYLIDLEISDEYLSEFGVYEMIVDDESDKYVYHSAVDLLA